LDRVEQSRSLRRQAGLSVQHLDPRSVTTLVAPLRLAVVSTKVTLFCLRFCQPGREYEAASHIDRC